MIQIASDRVNRQLYRAIVKTIADIAAWLSKHSLSIFLDLFIYNRASPGTRAGHFAEISPSQKIPQRYL